MGSDDVIRNETVPIPLGPHPSARPRNWENLSAAVQANPRRVIAVMVALAVPYLLICSGLAALVFMTMIGAGGCG